LTDSALEGSVSFADVSFYEMWIDAFAYRPSRLNHGRAFLLESLMSAEAFLESASALWFDWTLGRLPLAMHNEGSG